LGMKQKNPKHSTPKAATIFRTLWVRTLRSLCFNPTSRCVCFELRPNNKTRIHHYKIRHVGFIR
jgi:hypothetical protein